MFSQCTLYGLDRSYQPRTSVSELISISISAETRPSVVKYTLFAAALGFPAFAT